MTKNVSFLLFCIICFSVKKPALEISMSVFLMAVSRQLLLTRASLRN